MRIRIRNTGFDKVWEEPEQKDGVKIARYEI